jgi:hypothetical protein
MLPFGPRAASAARGTRGTRPALLAGGPLHQMVQLRKRTSCTQNTCNFRMKELGFNKQDGGLKLQQFSNNEYV